MSILNQTDTEEFIDVQPEDGASHQRVGIKDILSGRVLSNKTLTDQMPLLLLLVAMAVIYIGNNYRYNQLLRKEQELRKEVKNLRAESITTAAQYMFISRQSEVYLLVKRKGLKLEENKVPPYLIE